MARAHGLVAGGLLTAGLAMGCAKGTGTDWEVACGEGTVLIGRFCVPDDTAGAGGSGSGASSTTTSSSFGAGHTGEACDDGATQPRYGGPAGTQRAETCQDGTRTGATTDPCPGDTLPSAESCEGDDCNDTIDDDPRAAHPLRANLPGCDQERPEWQSEDTE